jgi:hypothetical protein
MVVFLNGDTDYAEKKMVFKRQANYRIGRSHNRPFFNHPSFTGGQSFQVNSGSESGSVVT